MEPYWNSLAWAMSALALCAASAFGWFSSAFPVPGREQSKDLGDELPTREDCCPTNR